MTKKTEVASLTPQQAAAIGTRGVSIALSAGAGCGKTFVLTRRFLSHLDPDAADGGVAEPLHGLVAITFTERAAREMRDRIRAECQKRLRQSDTGEVAHWLKILRGLDTARISTIHAFCSGVLRSHAVEAGFDPQFGVLDEATAAAIERRAVTETMQSLLERQDEHAMYLVQQFGWERALTHVRSLVVGRFHAGPVDFAARTVEEHANDWVDQWRRVFVPQLLREFVESQEAALALRLLHENVPDHEAMRERRDLLLRELPRLAEADDPLPALEQLREAAKVQGGGGRSVWSDEEIFNAVRDALTALRGAIDKLIKELNVDETDVQEAARVSLAAQHVVREAGAHYARLKEEASLLDFDDLLLRTRDLLKHNDAVRARASQGIDFLMIDEFQDTDPVQAEIVECLCGPKLLTGKLFLVGDVKQSIYRFRRAAPEVFVRLRNRIPERGRLPLSTNFRSQPEILKFVNCLFGPEFGEGYEPLVPHVEQMTPPPAIEFLFSRGADDDGGDGEDDRGSGAGDNGGRDSAESRRRREADWIARRICSLLRGSQRLVRRRNDATGKIELDVPRPGDVAILYRTLSNVGLYEEALREYGLDYYLVGGRSFFAQQEVYDLVNLCSYLDNPDDEISLAGVLRSPFFALTDDSLFAMVDAAGSLGEGLRAPVPGYLPEQQQDQIRHAARVLDELERKKDDLPLAALLKLAVDRTGYDASLLNEFLGRRKVANLNKLMEMARQFDRSGLCTLSEFVVQLRDSITEQTREELAATHPEASNVVRLMTIHQAKGLEFPIVVLADMDWTRGGGDSGAQYHPQLGPLVPLPRRRGESRSNLAQRMHRLAEAQADAEENTRLLYVAATRAADLLLLSAGLRSSGKWGSPWLQLLARRFNLETGLPALDPWLGRLSLGNVDPGDIPAIRVHQRPPEVPKGTVAHDKLAPLDQFRAAVEEAEPIPVPRLMTEIPPRAAGRMTISVSAVEEADPERAAPPMAAMESSFADAEPDAPVPAASLGTLVHAVLEKIDPRQQPAPIEAILDGLLPAGEAGSTASLRSAALARARVFVESDVFAEMARAKGLHREIDFLLGWPPGGNGPPETIIAGKIDCLLQTNEGRWLLLDYKTGQLPLTQPGAVIERYGLQLALYALAVRELIGRLPDAVEIIALDEELHRIPLRLTQEFLAAASRRVDEAVDRLRGRR